jgi:hypothetical protein
MSWLSSNDRIRQTFSLIVLKWGPLVHPFKRRHNSHSSRQLGGCLCLIKRTNLEVAQCPVPCQIQCQIQCPTRKLYPTHMANYLALSTQQIRKANIPFRVASTDTPSIQKRSLLFRVILVWRYHKQCLIMVRHILLTMASTLPRNMVIIWVII